MRNIIAVCDKEEEYAHRLMEYMNDKNAFTMKATAFSREESVEDFASYKKIDCILISENMMSEKMKSVNADKKIILRENANNDEPCEYKEIFKYQSAENIVRDVMSLYEAERYALGDNVGVRTKKRVIGVYSPIYHAAKTSFALELSRECSQRTPSLYINLESFSGLGEIIGCSDGCNLGDLLYYAGRSGVSICSRLTEAVVSFRGIEMIPPVQSPDDICAVSVERFKTLFAAVLNNTSYETLILDFGNEISDICEIIRLCTTVFIPEENDMIAQARLNDFSGYIRSRGIDESKLKRITIPDGEDSRTGELSDTNAYAGDIRAYVHTLMQREVSSG